MTGELDIRISDVEDGAFLTTRLSISLGWGWGGGLGGRVAEVREKDALDEEDQQKAES